MMSVNLKHDLFSLFFFNIPYRTHTVEIKNKMVIELKQYLKKWMKRITSDLTHILKSKITVS